jgi:hypothetical protein
MPDFKSITYTLTFNDPNQPPEGEPVGTRLMINMKPEGNGVHLEFKTEDLQGNFINPHDVEGAVGETMNRVAAKLNALTFTSPEARAGDKRTQSETLTFTHNGISEPEGYTGPPIDAALIDQILRDEFKFESASALVSLQTQRPLPPAGLSYRERQDFINTIGDMTGDGPTV